MIIPSLERIEKIMPERLSLLTLVFGTPITILAIILGATLNSAVLLYILIGCFVGIGGLAALFWLFEAASGEYRK